MNIADFSKLDAWKKLSIVEIELSRKLQEETWAQCGSPNTNAYFISLPEDGEVHKVTLDANNLAEKFSIADCHATASTFFYDDLNKILYVHTSGNDSPAATVSENPKYSVVAFFNEFISNRPKQLEPYEDILKEANGSLEFWTKSESQVAFGAASTGAWQNLRDTSADTLIAQSFKSSEAMDILSIKISLKKLGSPSGDVWVEIHSSQSGTSATKNASTNIVGQASDNINCSSISTSGFTWYTFNFSGTKPSISANTTYYLVVYGSFSIGGADHIKVTRDNSGYADGQRFTINGSMVWTGTTSDLSFVIDGEGGWDAEEWTEAKAGSSAIARESTEIYGTQSAFSCKFTVDASNSYCSLHRSDLYIKPGRKAKIRFRHKESTSGKTITAVLSNDASNVFLNSAGEWQTTATSITIPNSTSWAIKDINFIAHKDYSHYFFQIKRNSLASASAYIDNVEVWRYRRMVDCKTFLGENAIPSVRQSVGDFYRPDEQIQFGSIKCQNKNGWFYKRQLANGYLWHHRYINLYIGEEGDKYEDLTQFFGGVTRKPTYDKEAVIPVEDERVLLSKLPGPDTFDSTNYPNCEDSWKDRKIPILLGPVYDINPPQCNTSTKTFKPSLTTFGGTTYGIFAINAVYKNGTALTLTTDYTVDLTNGEFTLLCALSSGDVITCDALGLKCDILTNGKSSPTYTELVGDWVLFLYTVLNGISQYKIDLPTIIDLRNYRKLSCGKWITDEIESIDELITWKKSNVFQSYPTLDGIHTFPYYKDTVPSDALHFYNEDYASEPVIYEDSKQCFKQVTVKSKYLPCSGYYKYSETNKNDPTEWEHNVKREITFETILSTQFQARDVRDNYLAMLKKPPKFIEVPIKNHAALLLNPLDKAYFTYKKKDEEGNEIYKLNEDVFRILTLEKSENTGITNVTGILDDADFFWTIT